MTKYMKVFRRHICRYIVKHYRPSWGRLGPVLGPSWAVLCHLVAMKGPFWAVLGPSWACLGPSWAVLGPSWAILGRLEPVLGGLGRSLGGPGPHWGNLGASLEHILGSVLGSFSLSFGGRF